MLLAGCPGEKRCEKRCEEAADTELAKSEVIQTGHICFFQLAVCFWVFGLPLFPCLLNVSVDSKKRD